MASSGTIRPLYGVIIRDKCKYADVNTLMAYKTVAEDLLEGSQRPGCRRPQGRGQGSRQGDRRKEKIRSRNQDLGRVADSAVVPRSVAG